MTVRELIEKLKEFPQDMEVRAEYDGSCQAISTVEIWKDQWVDNREKWRNVKTLIKDVVVLE